MNWTLVKRWAPSVIIMAFIFFLSSVRGRAINEAGLCDDTLHVIGHFIMYFILCWAFYRGTKNITAAVLLTVLFGFTDEYHQTYTLERSASVKDLLTDTAAGLIAGGFLWKLYQNLPGILKNWLER